MSLTQTPSTTPPSSLLPFRDPERSFREAMHHKGINFQDPLVANGTLHRFASGGKGNKDGWYVFYGLAGAFGDWSQGIHELWSLKRNGAAAPNFEDLQTQIQKTQQQVAEERTRKQEEVAGEALTQWMSLAETGHSPYLERKKIEAFGVRFEGETIVVPLRDICHKHWSLQRIHPDGTKKFLSGGRKKGCLHLIGTLPRDRRIYVVEGYATGASIHMATGHPVAVAFDAGNLDAVVGALKIAYPHAPLIIAGDDDLWKPTNIGRLKAEEVAQKYGCSVVFPTFKNTDAQPTDFNDLHVLEGKEEVRRQLETPPLLLPTLKAVTARELLSLNIQPREMILSPILPEQGLAMIHAPRGIGKTHVSLMIAYAVATGGSLFNGKWSSLRPRKVLFVDGEMPVISLQERLARIVQSGQSEPPQDDFLRVITPDLQERGIMDLSTPEGQQHIEAHLKGVKLLILDNYSALCRKGRENEAESWIPVQEWFLDLRRRGMAVLLIHHSNKNGGQRGTSRKEDLLDTVITLKKPETYDPKEGARFEVHYEKARGFYGEAAVPFEVALVQEDGKFIWKVRDIENAQLSQVLALHKENLTQREIAEELGLSVSTVNRRIKQGKEREEGDGSTRQ